MPTAFSLLPALAALSVLAPAAMALEQPGSKSQPHAKPRLIAEHAAIAPGGRVWLGLTFDIDPHWHIYWDGDGDTGQPVTAEFTLPDGAKVGEIVWPAPKRQILAETILDYVYEKRVTVLVPFDAPANAKDGDVLKLSAALKWMECSEECIPRKATVQMELPVSASEPAKSPDAKRIEETRRRTPRSEDETAKAIKSIWRNDTISMTAPGAAGMIFYPHRTSVRLLDALNQADAKKDHLDLTIDTGPGTGGPERTGRLVGILEVVRTAKESNTSTTSEFYTVNLARPAPPRTKPPASETSTGPNQPNK